jgi:hypothetical protein
VFLCSWVSCTRCVIWDGNSPVWTLACKCSSAGLRLPCVLLPHTRPYGHRPCVLRKRYKLACEGGSASRAVLLEPGVIEKEVRMLRAASGRWL